ncbi:glycosyl transferase family 90-domain-containing protein [Chytriomyces cf. hyalinus JEL632]|nr:glycosyl transferase family 90-domain-containing protein [Chytriomyces cf. hyalinus JEL632]
MRTRSKLTRVHSYKLFFFSLASVTGVVLLLLWQPLGLFVVSDGTFEVEPSLAADLYKSHGQLTNDRPPPPGFAAWISFARANKCSVNLTSTYKQIYTDLESWRDGRTRLEYIKNAEKFDRIQITRIDAFQRVHSSRTAVIDALQPVAHLLKYTPTQQVWIAVNLLDEPRVIWRDTATASEVYTDMTDVVNSNQCLRDTLSESERLLHGFFTSPATFAALNLDHVPVFSQTKISPCYRDVLFPRDHHFEAVKLAESASDPIPWERKKRVLFWRGSTTGGRFDSSVPWRQYPRSRLVKWGLEYASKHPGTAFDAGVTEDVATLENEQLMVDVGFHHVNDAVILKDVETEYGGTKAHVSFQQMLHFKYLIVLDGNTWPGRLQSYLQTNSVILYNGIFADYYNWRLEPMIHYVPIKLDFSDLEEKLEWLMAHDDEARRISENARSLMAEVNWMSALHCYTGLLLLEYAALFHS